ncbi:hypothetical protein MPTK1_7g04180 [Marchantia polymorpha subsp. ruderalis]|uniref:Uncharacterized protein n=1 Tax=Marchantia polymorpha subsp. ruderalis TaxID=1480154 RepID=A0AAF6BW02_MARPO|nr:hypothetical protein Mp_7g04180 [Marchantia polymorpha subsp. ruderalis]
MYSVVWRQPALAAAARGEGERSTSGRIRFGTAAVEWHRCARSDSCGSEGASEEECSCFSSPRVLYRTFGARFCGREID